jgi:hypothetical protein
MAPSSSSSSSSFFFLPSYSNTKKKIRQHQKKEKRKAYHPVDDPARVPASGVARKSKNAPFFLPWPPTRGIFPWGRRTRGPQEKK